MAVHPTLPSKGGLFYAQSCVDSYAAREGFKSCCFSTFNGDLVRGA